MASDSLIEEGWIRKLRLTSIPSIRALAPCLRPKQSADRNAVRQRGFTLIELMIVVAVISLLAAIAYPSYVEQIRKTRRSDAKTALLETAQVLERCFTEFNVYNRPSIPTPGCPAVNAAGTGLLAPAYTLSEEGYYIISAGTLTSTVFTLLATPTGGQADENNAGKSNTCGVFSYSQTGAKGVSGGSITDPTICW